VGLAKSLDLVPNSKYSAMRRTFDESHPRVVTRAGAIGRITFELLESRGECVVEELNGGSINLASALRP